MLDFMRFLFDLSKKCIAEMQKNERIVMTSEDWSNFNHAEKYHICKTSHNVSRSGCLKTYWFSFWLRIAERKLFTRCSDTPCTNLILTTASPARCAFGCCIKDNIDLIALC